MLVMWNSFHEQFFFCNVTNCYVWNEKAMSKNIEMQQKKQKKINYKIRKLAEIDRHEEFVAADFYMLNLNLKSSLHIL